MQYDRRRHRRNVVKINNICDKKQKKKRRKEITDYKPNENPSSTNTFSFKHNQTYILLKTKRTQREGMREIPFEFSILVWVKL